MLQDRLGPAATSPSGRGDLFSSLLGERPGARLLAIGASVGEGCVSGRARYVACAEDLGGVRPGDIVMADHVEAEWRSWLTEAAAVVVSQGGGEALVGLGVPAVAEAGAGASPLWTGATLTVVAQAGAPGRVYQELTRADGGLPRSIHPFG